MPDEKVAVTEEDKTQEDVKVECSTCLGWIRARPPEEKRHLWGMDWFNFGECHGGTPSALAGDRRMVAQNDPSGENYVVVKQTRFPHTDHDDWCLCWKARG